MFQNSNISKSIIQRFAVFEMHPVSHNRVAAGQEGWNGLFVVIPKAAYMFRAPRSAGAQVNVTPLLCYLRFLPGFLVQAAPGTVSRLMSAPLEHSHPFLDDSVLRDAWSTDNSQKKSHQGSPKHLRHARHCSETGNSLKSRMLWLSYFPDEETEARDSK